MKRELMVTVEIPDGEQEWILDYTRSLDDEIEFTGARRMCGRYCVAAYDLANFDYLFQVSKRQWEDWNNEAFESSQDEFKEGLTRDEFEPSL